jgi:hypothetical protein
MLGLQAIILSSPKQVAAGCREKEVARMAFEGV